MYQMVSLSPQQCIRVLIFFGVGSEISSCCMYVPVYVFGIVSTVFFFRLFFSLFSALLRIKVYIFKPYLPLLLPNDRPEALQIRHDLRPDKDKA